MGETGVGKSTLINAFANYLVNNILNETFRGEMLLLIRSVFDMIDPKTFKEKTVSIGNPSDDEKCEKVGQSSTQVCRTYIFLIRNRIRRLIDASCIADVQDIHAVRDSLSINSVQQLIRKLIRPLGEIARLIQENIQLAEKYKQNVLKNPSLATPKQIPQKTGKIIEFDYLRTVCTNKKCIQIIVVDDERKVHYVIKCHPHCYLRDAERECVGHSILQHIVMQSNKHTGYFLI